jgi:hypothetical protein
MATRYVADGIRHREYRQAERERYADESDAEAWEGSGEDGTAATAEYQPKGSDEFGGQAL